MLRESSIESAFKNRLTRWGIENNLQIYIWKLSVPGLRGVPDRVILWEGGHALFIEFKVPGRVETKLQAFVHSRLRNMGFPVEVHDDAKLALESAKAHILATSPANARHEDDGARRR